MTEKDWEEIKENLRDKFFEKFNESSSHDFIKYVEKAHKNKDVLLECVTKYGSPLYVLDEDFLVERAEGLFKAFRIKKKNIEVFYAFKSNDLPYMINILKNKGLHADVAGLFELMLALRLGFDKIIFTGPFRTDEEIELCIKNSDRVFLNIDNKDELDLILEKLDKKKIKKPLMISFRLNLNKNHEQWGKFGLELNQLKEAVLKVKNSQKAVWKGIHFHSSWNSSPEKYVQNIKDMSEYLEKFFSEDELSDLSFVDIGGGFMPEGFGSFFSSSEKGKLMEIANKPFENRISFNMADSIEIFADTIIKEIEKSIFGEKRLDLELWIEPGRYISSLPTSILLKVLSVKGGNIYVDGGINLLGSSNFDFEYVPVINISRPSKTENKSKIYGPLCDPDDHWGNRYFGEKAKPGDILAVVHQGAYTFSTAWRWQKPIAPYVSFNNSKVKIVKDRETFEDRYSGCKFE
jgi:diaminopimelate decarboxylase